MKVLMNTGGIASTNSFLVADEQAKQAVLFDAPNDTTGMLLDEAKKQGWEVIGLWLTHGHFDHMADHPLVSEHFPNAKVLIHRLDAPKLRDPSEQMRLFGLPIRVVGREPDGLLEEGQKLSVGSLTFEVLHTPGHSAGHVAYYCDGPQKILVGGDLIIMGSVGRTDLPDSSYATLQESLRRVMGLPGETRLLPGHGETTTLDEERRSNPYVQEALLGR